jgi:hypothetical protein
MTTTNLARYAINASMMLLICSIGQISAVQITMYSHQEDPTIAAVTLDNTVINSRSKLTVRGTIDVPLGAGDCFKVNFP